MTRIPLRQHIYVKSVGQLFIMMETEEPDDGISVFHIDPRFQKDLP